MIVRRLCFLDFSREVFLVIFRVIMELIVRTASSAATARVYLSLNCHSVGPVALRFFPYAGVRLEDVFDAIVDYLLRIVEEEALAAV